MEESVSAEPPAVDFQHRLRRRESDLLCLFDSLEYDTPGLVKLVRRLKWLRSRLDFPKPEWRTLRDRLLLIYGYKRLVAREHKDQPSLIFTEMPPDIMTEVETFLPEDSATEGITVLSVKVPRNSKVDRWVRDNYLVEARKRYRGVFGYSAHVRYAYNSGVPQSWDSRFVTPHANFHWDQACNSFPFVVYLSDVGDHDGAFSVLADSLAYQPNLFLAAYDRFLTDRDGIDAHNAGDIVGRYLDTVPTGGIIRFKGPPGTGVMFEGRSVVHDGGFPDAGGRRLVIFFNALNPLMGVMDRLLRRS